MNSIEGMDFIDAPSNIEGSPYYVDKWAYINGYYIGIQVKPRSFSSSSLSIYASGAKAGMKRGHQLFESHFGGRVFVVVLEEGEVIDAELRNEIIAEIGRLQHLPEGPNN